MIYFDHNATTPLDSYVLERMLPFLNQASNPSSPHHLGKRARLALIQAKEEICKQLATKKHEVLFTSSATEALNTVIASISKGAHIITSALEHVAILEACRAAEHRGVRVTYLDPLYGKGAVSLKQIESAIEGTTALVAIGAANHETGILNPWKEIADLCEKRAIPLLLDAVGIIGREVWECPSGNCAFCISSHKIYGPQGAAALIYPKEFPLKPFILGGGQQKGLRGGTENVASIVGMAEAVKLLPSGGNLDKIRGLRDEFEHLLSRDFDVSIIGKEEKRVVNTSKIVFHDQDAELIFMQLDLKQVALSFGSACGSNSRTFSHVLQAMRVPSDWLRSSLRFSIGKTTKKEEIYQAILILSSIVKISKNRQNSLASAQL